MPATSPRCGGHFLFRGSTHYCIIPNFSFSFIICSIASGGGGVVSTGGISTESCGVDNPMKPIETYYPAPALRRFIQYFMFVDLDESILLGSSSNLLKVMPSTFASLILFFTEPSYKEMNGQKVQLYDFGITGYNTSPKKYLRQTALRQMIICFTPIGIQQFLNFALKEITDTHAPIDLVFGDQHERLINEVCQTDDRQKQVAVFEDFFIKKLSRQNKPDKRIRPLVNHIFQTNGSKSIKELSRPLGIGERTIQRLIHKYVGINFKMFSRLVRFRAARSLLNCHSHQLNLTEVAHQLKYFDQSHFIHDFQELSGQTPGDYLTTKRLKMDIKLNLKSQVDKFI